MQATFDNKTNLLNANIRSSVDHSVLYTVTTTHNLWGRTLTVLKDANPVFGDPPIVGAIHWREKQFVVQGHRRSIHDLKRKEPAASVPGCDEKKKKQTRKSAAAAAGPNNPGQKRNGAEKGQNHHDHEHHHHHHHHHHRRHHSSREGGCQHVRTRRESMPALSNTRRRSSVSFASAPASSSSLKASLSLFTRHLGQIEMNFSQWWRSVTFNPRYWQWAADRVEYQVSYQHEEWQVLAIPTRHTSTRYSRLFEKEQAQTDVRRPTVDLTKDDDDDNMAAGVDEKAIDDDRYNGILGKVTPSASLQIPYRTHLFHKTSAPVLHMRSSALLQDEAFLLLVLIYSETRRQEHSNSSAGW